jgi:TolA-binding protein
VPRAAWTLDAGPYIVHVTGTEFDLAWRVDEQTLDLRLIEGSVTVNGPLANGGLKMVAGQHLVANATDGSLSIVNGLGAKAAANDAPQAATPPTGVKTAWTAAMDPPALTSPSRALASTASARAGVQTWAARVARGDFAAVIDDAERRGLERSLAEGSPVDLAALADAARYARRPDLARRALTAQRARFPAAVQARDAAFFLGGLTEQKDDGAAAEWYDVYLRESPQGAYASQALGRKMMLLERTRDADGARRTAIEYLQRFASGPYAPAARKLLP